MFESRQGHSFIALFLFDDSFPFIFSGVKAYESSITQIQSFEQFVQFYGKQYRDDEYAYITLIRIYL